MYISEGVGGDEESVDIKVGYIFGLCVIYAYCTHIS